MTRYEYKCINKKCKVNIFIEYLPMKDYKKKVKCPQCKKIGQKQFATVPTHISWSTWRAGH